MSKFNRRVIKQPLPRIKLVQGAGRTESEKVLNVPSILRVTVMMFLNVDNLRGDILYSKIC